MESAARNLTVSETQSKVVSVKVPATGGELWQGTAHGRLVMVNCPISYYGEVVATAIQGESGVRGVQEASLVRSAAELVLGRLAMNYGLHIEVRSPVPRGLGMASSTTELSATAYAAARALGLGVRAARDLAHLTVNQLDSGNDANYTAGLHLVDPRLGLRLLSFRSIPEMKMLVVNTGGHLDTAHMNRDLEREIGRQFSREMERSLTRMISGLSFSDFNLIGEAATESTLIYQQISPKPELDEVLHLACATPGVVGVASGHSGTLLAVLAPVNVSFEGMAQELEQIYGRANIIGEYNLVSGGFHESDSN
jgi:L-threonine kinase